LPLERRSGFWVLGLDAMPWRRRADARNGTPDHDVTVRSGTVFGPAPINIGDGSERRM